MNLIPIGISNYCLSPAADVTLICMYNTTYSLFNFHYKFLMFLCLMCVCVYHFLFVWLQATFTIDRSTKCIFNEIHFGHLQTGGNLKRLFSILSFLSFGVFFFFRSFFDIFINWFLINTYIYNAHSLCVHNTRHMHKQLNKNYNQKFLFLFVGFS